MERLRSHTKGGTWGTGSPWKNKSLNFPFLLNVTPSPPSLPWSQTTYWKKVSPTAFRKILPKILLVVYIFSNTIMTNLKKLIGNKSLNTKQCPAGLSPWIIPLNLYGKPWGWGKYQPTANNLLIFPSRKILFISSPYTSFICSCSHFFKIQALYVRTSHANFN